jgi:hypothetical protein
MGRFLRQTTVLDKFHFASVGSVSTYVFVLTIILIIHLLHLIPIPNIMLLSLSDMY